MASFIGIDLGTTYSAVAYVDDTGRPKVVHNSDGNNLTPSCVEFSDDSVVVGESARRQLGLTDTVVARFKRDMGTSEQYDVGGQSYTPTDLSAFVLKKLVQDAQREIGDICEAVVTIPANFANEARSETLIAAKEAGINVNYIVNEPTAAALYYAFKSGDSLSGNYAVYDLGGGTFDVSILSVKGQDITVITSDGVSRLGGDDFDIALQQLVKKKYKEKTGDDLAPEDFTKTDAEEEKKSLTKRDSVNVRVMRVNIKITREEFEDEISSLVAQAEMLCESVIDDAGLTPDDINEVFLVGGSTRIPKIHESVKRAFNKDPVSFVNVDEVVVLGACLYAAYKGDQTQLTTVQKNAIQRIKVLEATSKCFGTISLSYNQAKDEDVLQVSILIKKNEKIPCSVTESFYTTHDGQENIHCQITESVSAETDPRFVNVVWDGNLSLPPGRPKGREVTVTYSFDENQTMHASFLDVETAKETKISLSALNVSADKKSKIEKFIVE